MRHGKRNQGFSLIEMMVALTISLIVLTAALQALNNVTRSNEVVIQLAEMQQNLRAGINLIVRDAMQAGQGIPTGGIPLPSGAVVQPIVRPGPPGFSYTFPLGTTSVSAVLPGAGMGPVMEGQNTDMVTFLYADSTLPLNQTPLTAIAVDGSSMTVDAGTPINDASNGIRPGDLILFSNANGNALQEVTSTLAQGQVVSFDGGDPLNLNQRNAPNGTILCLQNEAGGGNPNDCSDNSGGWPVTTATRVWMITFYLDALSNPAQPRLVRRIGANSGRAVSDSIENVQLSFDLIDGVTNPVNVKTPTAPNSPNQIRRINLFLAGRSNGTYSQTAEFFRNSLATQISLRSLALVNRY